MSKYPPLGSADCGFCILFGVLYSILCYVYRYKPFYVWISYGSLHCKYYTPEIHQTQELYSSVQIQKSIYRFREFISL